MRKTIQQQAIEQFFSATEISYFIGTLNSLVQMISRATGIHVQGIDLLEYLYLTAGISTYCIKVCFENSNICTEIKLISFQ